MSNVAWYGSSTMDGKGSLISPSWLVMWVYHE